MAARKSTSSTSSTPTSSSTPAPDARHQVGWGGTPWAVLDDLPKDGGKRPAKRTTAAGSGPSTAAPSNRAMRRARVARRAAYREAVLMAAAGAALVNLDGLRGVGLKVASRRPRTPDEDVGGMDAALDAMESAAKREVPTANAWFDGVVDGYHAGVDVWHDREDVRRAKEEEAEAAAVDARRAAKAEANAAKAAKAATKAAAPPGRRRPR